MTGDGVAFCCNKQNVFLFLFLLLHIVVIEMLLLGYGEGDRANREDREDRDAYRRGGAADADGMSVVGFGMGKCDYLSGLQLVKRRALVLGPISIHNL